MRALIKTGLDFAGPYEIKVGRVKARPKYYILLFTCLPTRAVHLEVTPAMDTNAVVLAFDRFIAYRGCPTDFLSDNWKTFISKDKELEHWVRNISVLDTITSKHAEINWHFTPLMDLTMEGSTRPWSRPQKDVSKVCVLILT